MTLCRYKQGAVIVTNLRQRGFTLLELMITIAVLAILMSTAIPAMRTTIQNNRMSGISNELVTALQLARSEAIKRSAPVSVCASSDQASCTGGWEDGWIVFLDGSAIGQNSATVSEILQVWGSMGGSVSNDGDDPDFIRYIPNGAVDRAADFPVVFKLEIPNCRGDNNRDIEVVRTGRAAISRADCS